jgi:hypothetical protein
MYMAFPRADQSTASLVWVAWGAAQVVAASAVRSQVIFILVVSRSME